MMVLCKQFCFRKGDPEVPGVPVENEHWAPNREVMKTTRELPARRPSPKPSGSKIGQPCSFVALLLQSALLKSDNGTTHQGYVG